MSEFASAFAPVLKEAIKRAAFFGWVLLIFGVLLFAADHWDLPAQGVLKPWLGAAGVTTILGLALIIPSIGKAGWEALRREDQEVLKLQHTLTSNERQRLVQALEAIAPTFEFNRYTDNAAFTLMEKGIFKFVTETGDGLTNVCEVDPAYWRHRRKLIRRLSNEPPAARPARR